MPTSPTKPRSIWQRFQLARELLAQYEHEEAIRVPWNVALARIQALNDSPAQISRAGAASWRQAIEAQAGRYPRE